MNAGLVGLYAVFLIFAGYRGNASILFKDISSDAKGFSEWVIAILILRALYSIDTLKPFIKPFAALAVLTFVLKNYNTVAAQVDTITGSKFGAAQDITTTAPNIQGANGTIGSGATNILGNLFNNPGTQQ